MGVALTEYERYLAPYVRITTFTAWRLQEQARPYVILVWYKSVDGYRCVKPYVRPAWERCKDAVLRVFAYLAVFRRRFVDPHVAQMWAKIKELSGDKVVSTTKSVVTPKPVPPVDALAKEPSTVAAILAEEDTHLPTATPTPIPPPVLSDDKDASPEPPYVTTVTPGAINIMGDGPTDPIRVLVEPEVVPREEDQISEVAESTKQEPASVTPPVHEAPSPTPTSAQKSVTPVSSVNSEDEGDFEFFSTEIGLDLDESEDAIGEEVRFTPSEESEEEREARLKAKAEETAWKRKEITDRHTDWEYQLEDLKGEQMQVFKLSLYNVRKTAAKMLKKDSSVQRAVDEFAADGDRYLRGAEGYLKNLSKEKKLDKSVLWERVIQKVEDKYEKRLDDVDRKVGDWYNEVAADEKTMVNKATTTVTEFAQKAQVDLALDYSWLDDVTVEDWARYHDLMRCALIPSCLLKFVLTISLTRVSFAWAVYSQ